MAKDPTDQNAEDIRSLTLAVTNLTGELKANGERTDKAIDKADEARDELKEHIDECTEANRRQDSKLWIILIAAAALLGEKFWSYLGAAV